MDFLGKLLDSVKNSIAGAVAMVIAFGLVKYFAWKEWTDVALSVSVGFLAVGVTAKAWKAIAESRAHSKHKVDSRNALKKGIVGLGTEEKAALKHLLYNGSKTATLDLTEPGPAGLIRRHIITRISDVSNMGTAFAMGITNDSYEIIEQEVELKDYYITNNTGRPRREFEF